MKLIIRNKTYIMTERKAADVLALTEVKIKEDSGRDNIFFMTAAIYDSIMATYSNLRWYQRLKRFKYWKIKHLGKEHLLYNLTMQDIVIKFTELMETEGLKKKDPQVVKKSEENLVVEL